MPRALLEAICADLGATLEAKRRHLTALTASVEQYLAGCDPQRLDAARRDLSLLRDLNQVTTGLLFAADAALTRLTT